MSRRHHLLAVLVLVGACTEPAHPLTVQVTRTVTVNGTPDSTYSPPGVECLYRVSATTAGGRPGDYAQWLSIVEIWTLPSYGNYTYVDTLPADSAAAPAEWGTDRITQAQTLTEERWAGWAAPFDLARTYHYRLASGRLDSTTFTLYCN